MQVSTELTRKTIASNGHIEGVSMTALFWAFYCERASGVLSIERDGITKRVYLEDGEVIFAVSEDFDDRLGEYFLRTDRLTIDDLESVLPDLDGSVRIGTLLVQRNLISPEDLTEGVRTQIFDFLLDLFRWETGAWSFEEGSLPDREEIQLSRPMWDLILEAFKQERSFLRLRRMVGPLGVLLQLSGPTDPADYGDSTQSLIEALAEGPRTLGEVLDSVYLSNFEACQHLAALRTIGVIEYAEPVLSTEATSREGALGVCGLGPILVDLCRGEETGVLKIVDDTRERSFHLREGNLVFATSNDLEDGLLAFLLRRGVISLQDREEVARRLLTNKRIGTILREVHVIDEEDLERMVREQLREIVQDSLTWEGGRYAWHSGELPTHEPIVLEQSLEQLIAEAYRRVETWSKLKRGSGGLDRIVQLTPDYESVLDRMEIGPEEWEILTLLRQPTSGLTICRGTEIGAFRVAKILWTMRTLEAIEDVSEEMAERVRAEESERAAELLVEEIGDSTLEVPKPALEYALGDDATEEIPVEVVEPQVEVVEEIAEDVAVEYVAAEPEAEHEPEPEPEMELHAESAAEVEPLDDGLLEALDACDEDDVDDRYVKVLDRDAIEGLSRNLEETDSLDVGDTTIDDPLLDPFEEPETLAEAIDRLNDRQRVMFRAIRAEIGAGAVNFVRSCADNIVVDDGSPFEEAELESDGSWNRETLREAVVRHRIDDPETGYRQLIEDQVEMLRGQIGDRRARQLTYELGL
jgi:hypothetical protein